ncbi:MAG: hypothetical protein A3E87_04675 [Gammaproteobacteria bacterium RIFCSPHIGHO2_12_FULL_35_23]|nr:MAG: hypothetical protein A3E87_04675 [Gammaproteobacteria bacterium RIFCSPHIGHO2_12_FULL_35_23]
MPEHGTLRPKIDEIRLALTQIEEQIDQSEKARLAEPLRSIIETYVNDPAIPKAIRNQRIFYDILLILGKMAPRNAKSDEKFICPLSYSYLDEMEESDKFISTCGYIFYLPSLMKWLLYEELSNRELTNPLTRRPFHPLEIQLLRSYMKAFKIFNFYLPISNDERQANHEYIRRHRTSYTPTISDLIREMDFYPDKLIVDLMTRFYNERHVDLIETSHFFALLAQKDKQILKLKQIDVAALINSLLNSPRLQVLQNAAWLCSAIAKNELFNELLITNPSIFDNLKRILRQELHGPRKDSKIINNITLFFYNLSTRDAFDGQLIDILLTMKHCLFTNELAKNPALFFKNILTRHSNNQLLIGLVFEIIRSIRTNTLDEEQDLTWFYSSMANNSLYDAKLSIHREIITYMQEKLASSDSTIRNNAIVFFKNLAKREVHDDILINFLSDIMELMYDSTDSNIRNNAAEFFINILSRHSSNHLLVDTIFNQTAASASIFNLFSTGISSASLSSNLTRERMITWVCSEMATNALYDGKLSDSKAVSKFMKSMLTSQDPIVLNNAVIFFRNLARRSCHDHKIIKVVIKIKNLLNHPNNKVKENAIWFFNSLLRSTINNKPLEAMTNCWKRHLLINSDQSLDENHCFLSHLFAEKEEGAALASDDVVLKIKALVVDGEPKVSIAAMNFFEKLSTYKNKEELNWQNKIEEKRLKIKHGDSETRLNAANFFLNLIENSMSYAAVNPRLLQGKEALDKILRQLQSGNLEIAKQAAETLGNFITRILSLQTQGLNIIKIMQKCIRDEDPRVRLVAQEFSDLMKTLIADQRVNFDLFTLLTQDSETFKSDSVKINLLWITAENVKYLQETNHLQQRIRKTRNALLIHGNPTIIRDDVSSLFYLPDHDLEIDKFLAFKVFLNDKNPIIRLNTAYLFSQLAFNSSPEKFTDIIPLMTKCLNDENDSTKKNAIVFFTKLLKNSTKFYFLKPIIPIIRNLLLNNKTCYSAQYFFNTLAERCTKRFYLKNLSQLHLAVPSMEKLLIGGDTNNKNNSTVFFLKLVDLTTDIEHLSRAAPIIQTFLKDESYLLRIEASWFFYKITKQTTYDELLNEEIVLSMKTILENDEESSSQNNAASFFANLALRPAFDRYLTLEITPIMLNLLQSENKKVRCYAISYFINRINRNIDEGPLTTRLYTMMSILHNDLEPSVREQAELLVLAWQKKCAREVSARESADRNANLFFHHQQQRAVERNLNLGAEPNINAANRLIL